MSRTVFLIAGPSGSGKTSLTQALTQRMKGLTKGITVTTRAPRLGEVNGKDYFFVTPGEFAMMEERGALLETDKAYQEWYGVPHSVLEPIGDIALIVTVTGAMSLKRLLPYCMTLFIVPKSAEVAANRLAARNCPNELFRVQSYESEVAGASRFDAVLHNLDFNKTLSDLENVIHARRRSTYFHIQPFDRLHHAN
jgi:guanylate kinase